MPTETIVKHESFEEMSPSARTTAATDEEATHSSTVTPDDKGGIKEPDANDVLCGRGGSINSHPGNERFRSLVEKRKRVYLTARFKREKRLIASSIVTEIRRLNGRFLSRDPKSGLWKDIGDEKARDKTSQALRENAPSIRAEIEEEINEQRAEMYKKEESHRYPPPPGGSYYNSWYHSYYGYSQGPPPPPPPQSAYPHHPPPPPHGYPHHPSQPPPAPHGHHPPHPQYDYYAQQQHHYPEPPPQHRPQSKNAVESTADYISSGAESIKSWTKAITQYAVAPSASADGNASTTSSKPISYRHCERRKSVTFSQNTPDKPRRKRPCYSPVQSNDSIGDSLMDHDMDGQDELEPHDMNVDTNTSIMSQFANQLLGGLGSWDGGTICGFENNTEEKVPFPKAGPSEYTQDTDTTVEWEGQEVQLVDDRKDEDRMPPPQRREPIAQSNNSIAFSSIGSCHSWLPEQMGAAASYFSGRDDNGSIDMSGMENMSAGGSIGGGSLTRVFEGEAASSPHMMRGLNQMPSWERSFRSRSPLSVGTDDESLISKTSSKGAISPVPSTTEDMNWTRE